MRRGGFCSLIARSMGHVGLYVQRQFRAPVSTDQTGEVNRALIDDEFLEGQGHEV